MKGKLAKSRYNEAYQDREKGGTSRRGVIDWKKITKEDIKFYTPTLGLNKVNIIPFAVKSKNHPMVRSGTMEPGDLDFMLDIYVHRYVGPDNSDVVCPKRNFGKSCPICDLVKEYYDTGKKEEAKRLQCSRRVFLNIQPIVDDEPQGLKVFEVSHHLFIKELIEEANECKEGNDILPFADLKDGKIIKFRATEEEMGQNKYMGYKSFAFLDRTEELDEKILDQALSFDEGMVILSHEEIEKVLYGQDEDTSNKKEAKSAPAEKAPTKTEEEDTRDRKPCPAPADKESKESSKCPNGFGWGEADKHRECGKCKVWDDCIEAKK